MYIPRILINSFIETIDIYLSFEFFINLIPCYLFIIIGFCRYVSLFRLSRFRYIEENEENDSESLSESPLINEIDPPPALFIKKKLSYFIAFLYIISIFLAFLFPNDWFWAANYQWESLFYLVGVIGWVLSGQLIQLEYDKEYYQELYTHKLLCPLTMMLSFINLLLKRNVKFFLVQFEKKLELFFSLFFFVYFY